MSTITSRSVKRALAIKQGNKNPNGEMVHEFYDKRVIIGMVPSYKRLPARKDFFYRVTQDRIRIYHPTKGWRDRNLAGIGRATLNTTR